MCIPRLGGVVKAASLFHRDFLQRPAGAWDWAKDWLPDGEMYRCGTDEIVLPCGVSRRRPQLRTNTRSSSVHHHGPDPTGSGGSREAYTLQSQRCKRKGIGSCRLRSRQRASPAPVRSLVRFSRGDEYCSLAGAWKGDDQQPTRFGYCAAANRHTLSPSMPRSASALCIMEQGREGRLLCLCVAGSTRSPAPRMLDTGCRSHARTDVRQRRSCLGLADLGSPFEHQITRSCPLAFALSPGSLSTSSRWEVWSTEAQTLHHCPRLRAPAPSKYQAGAPCLPRPSPREQAFTNPLPAEIIC